MAHGRAFSSWFSRDAAGMVYPLLLDLGVLTESLAFQDPGCWPRMLIVWSLYALTESLAFRILGLWSRILMAWSLWRSDWINGEDTVGYSTLLGT